MLILACLYYYSTALLLSVLGYFFFRPVCWLITICTCGGNTGKKNLSEKIFSKTTSFFFHFRTCCITLYTNTERKRDIVSRFTVSLLLISIRERRATRKHQSKGKKLAWTCSKIQDFWIVWTRCIFKQPKSNNYWKHLCSIKCSRMYPSLLTCRPPCDFSVLNSWAAPEKLVGRGGHREPPLTMMDLTRGKC